MQTNRQKLGKKGEEMAVNYLRNSGYEILRCNYQAGHHEIDIIARQENDLVFVEVKSVRSPRYGSAEFRIPLKKQRSVIQAAYSFLNNYPISEQMGVRFDVICVNLENYPAGLAHYKGAFWQQR